jgi:hypothetical protein
MVVRGFPRHRKIHKHKDICDGATTCGTLLMDSSITSPDSSLLTSFTWNPAVASMFRATVSIRWLLPLLCVCARASPHKHGACCQLRHNRTPSSCICFHVLLILSLRTYCNLVSLLFPSGCCTQHACSLKILSAAFADLMIGWHMSES